MIWKFDLLGFGSLIFWTDRTKLPIDEMVPTKSNDCRTRAELMPKTTLYLGHVGRNQGQVNPAQAFLGVP